MNRQFEKRLSDRAVAIGHEGKRLISVHPPDLLGLDRMLADKLRRYGLSP